MKMGACIILSILFVTYSSGSLAQKKSRFFAEAAPGFTLPVGKFANKIWNENNSLSNSEGLANAGFDISLSGGWHAKRNLALLVGGSYGNNRQDANSFRNYFIDKYGGQVQASVVTESWDIFKIMAGPLFSMPLNNKSNLIVRAKLLAGASKTSIPGYTYAYSYTDPVSNLPRAGMSRFTKISLPWAFCWQATAGIKYKTANKLYLFSEAGYFTASLNYSYTSFNPSQGGFFNGSKKIVQSYLGLYAGAGIDF